MKTYIEKFCQKIANRILVKMENSESIEETNILFEIGMMLDRWCMNRGIELK